MRLFIIFYLCLNSISLYTQKLHEAKTGFIEIVQIDSLKKGDIYKKVKEWVALSYRSSNQVLQLDTEDKIIVRANFSFSFNVTNDNTSVVATKVVGYDLLISMRDYKIKIDFTPFEMYTEPYINMKEIDLIIYLDSVPMTKEEFFEFNNKKIKEGYKNLGYSEAKYKRDKKLIGDNVDEIAYTNYIECRKFIRLHIENRFKDFKEHFKTVDNDW